MNLAQRFSELWRSRKSERERRAGEIAQCSTRHPALAHQLRAGAGWGEEPVNDFARGPGRDLSPNSEPLLRRRAMSSRALEILPPDEIDVTTAG